MEHDNPQIYNAVENARKMGATLFACVPFPNPKDYFLAKVLCYTERNEYVVWTFNYADGGFHNGVYHNELANALECLRDKMIELGWDQ